MSDTAITRYRIPEVSLLLLFLIAFAPTLVWMVEAWFAAGSYYGHGPLLVICGVVFLYRAREHLRSAGVEASKAGLWLFAGLLLCHVLAQVIQVDSLSGVLMVPAALALVWAVYGPMVLRLSAPAIGCFIFAVPLPIFVTGRLAYALKDFAASAAVFIGNLLGLGLERDGARLIIPGQDLPLMVGDACAGLRSLVALTALGYVFAFFLTDRKPIGRAILLLSALPVALMANFLRIAVLAAIASWKGVDFAAGTAHDVSGYLIYLAAIFVLFVIDRFLPFRQEVQQEEAAAGAVRDGPAHEPVEFLRICALVLLFAVPAVFFGFDRPRDPRMALAKLVPEETAQFRSLGDVAISERWYGLLGTRDVCWRRYAHKRLSYGLNLTVVFHGSNWKSVHPPDTCLAASGFEIESRTKRKLTLGDLSFTLAVLHAKKKTHAYLVAYAYAGPGFFTASYLGFFLENLPSALVRRPTRGCLLRVDVPLDPENSMSDAEARLSMFLSEILPAIRGLLH